jgi:two-component system, OmpR family, phosphate regulon sensor histidine kinase PhoR
MRKLTRLLIVLCCLVLASLTASIIVSLCYRNYPLFFVCLATTLLSLPLFYILFRFLRKEDIKKKLSKEEIAKQSEELAKAEKEQRFNSLLLDSVSDCLFALDEDKRIVFASKKARRLIDIDDPIGKKLEETSNIDSLISLVSLFKAEERTLHKEIIIAPFVYWASLSKIDEFYFLALSDITLEKKSERERQDFFNASSHELKTPLTAIQGYSEILALKEEDPLNKEIATKIYNESKRMSSLIADMLSISKIDEREKPKGLPLLPLGKVSEEVVSSLAPLAEKKGIKISVKGEGEAPILESDAYSIIKNLVENSIKYGIQNGRTDIELSSECLRVIDNGIGIDNADQSRVFERFYQVSKGKNRDEGGTGLGLAIIKHLCELYGFKIRLNSALGKGSEFEIIFK